MNNLLHRSLAGRCSPSLVYGALFVATHALLTYALHRLLVAVIALEIVTLDDIGERENKIFIFFFLIDSIVLNEQFPLLPRMRFDLHDWKLNAF